jgi:hypothetical protein
METATTYREDVLYRSILPTRLVRALFAVAGSSDTDDPTVVPRLVETAIREYVTKHGFDPDTGKSKHRNGYGRSNGGRR